jgi:glycerol-3-phosphate dehydrogenase
MPSLSTELLVIGAGATGLGIAWDACLRGIKVVVVDQGDIAQGTSGRYHGLLHSGGRYALIDPGSAQECASENKVLRRIIPHAIEDTGGLYLSLHSDPASYADEWHKACQNVGITSETISPSQALQREPALTKNIAQAFLVNAASLDSFDLLDCLAVSIRHAGGQILLHHQVRDFIIDDNVLVAVQLLSKHHNESVRIGAEVVVNAAGPWADQVANLAGINIPLTHSRGTLIAMANRLVHTVIHRCRPPSDGDAIVPVGTVMVMGTTDIPVSSADDHSIDPSEIDFLLGQGDELIPGFANSRPLRAWAGIRPLYNPGRNPSHTTRKISRAHVLIDHAENDQLSGFVSIFGGKLSTYRLMAQEVVDLVSKKIQIDEDCATDSVPLDHVNRNYYTLPDRIEHLTQFDETPRDSVICECEIVKRSDIDPILHDTDRFELENLRRLTRLGMGPCQAAFCAVRASEIACESFDPSNNMTDLLSFIGRRWRGTAALPWGHNMRQMILARRLYLELLDIHQFKDDES